MIKRFLPILALAGALCGLAAAATPAVAETWQCKGKVPCRYKLQGKGAQVLTLPSGTTVKCEKIRAEGQQSTQRAKDLQFRPVYTGCTATVAGVKHEAAVKTEKCQFRLILLQNSPVPRGVVEIKKAAEPCPILVTIKGTTCEVKITEEGNKELKKFEAKDEREKPQNIQLQFLVSGVSFKATAGCGENKGTAEFKGRARITGEIRIR